MNLPIKDFTYYNIYILFVIYFYNNNSTSQSRSFLTDHKWSPPPRPTAPRSPLAARRALFDCKTIHHPFTNTPNFFSVKLKICYQNSPAGAHGFPEPALTALSVGGRSRVARPSAFEMQNVDKRNKWPQLSGRPATAEFSHETLILPSTGQCLLGRRSRFGGFEPSLTAFY